MPASLLVLALLAVTGRAQQPTATLLPENVPGPLPASVTTQTQSVPAVQTTRAVNDPRVQQMQGRTLGLYSRIEETGQDIDIRFDLPGPELLFRLDSEDALVQRMRQERRKYKKDELTFPEQPVLAKESYHGREWPRMKMLVEAHYVCHKRLLFEELNTDRYGWELGLFQPLVSAAIFYKDVVFLPYHRFTDPCRRYECSAGKCLPGDPVPLLLYPPELSISGAAAQIFTMGILTAVFP